MLLLLVLLLVVLTPSFADPLTDVPAVYSSNGILVMEGLSDVVLASTAGNTNLSSILNNELRLTNVENALASTQISLTMALAQTQRNLSLTQSALAATQAMLQDTQASLSATQGMLALVLASLSTSVPASASSLVNVVALMNNVTAQAASIAKLVVATSSSIPANENFLFSSSSLNTAINTKAAQSDLMLVVNTLSSTQSITNMVNVPGLQTTVNTHTSNFASVANALSASNSINNLWNVTGIASSLTSTQTTVAGQGSSITTLTNRIISDETTITAQGNSISTLNTQLLATQNNVSSQGSLISALTSRVTGDESTIANQGISITNLTTRIANDEATIASHTATITTQGNSITSLTTRITTDEATITAQGNSITSQGTSISASTSALNSYISSNNAALASTNTQLSTTMTSLSSTQTSLTTLTTAHNTYVTSNNAAVGAVQAQVNSILACNQVGLIYSTSTSACANFPIPDLRVPTLSASLVCNSTSVGQLSFNTVTKAMQVCTGSTVTPLVVATLGTPQNPASSCASIYSAGLPNGNYTISVSGTLSLIYCYKGLQIPDFILLPKIPYAYYPFDTSINDVFGLHNPTVGGGSVLVTATGRLGNAASFDGSSSWLLFASIPDSYWRGAWTVSMWVKYTAVNKGSYNMLFSMGSPATAVGLHTGEYGNFLALNFYSDDLNAPYTQRAAQWYHVTLSYSGSGLKKIYINGELKTSAQQTPFSGSGGNTRLGQASWGGSFMYGLIDDVILYTGQLSDSVVAALHNGYGYSYGVGSVTTCAQVASLGWPNSAYLLSGEVNGNLVPTYCFAGYASQYPFLSLGTPFAFYPFDNSLADAINVNDPTLGAGAVVYQTGYLRQCLYFPSSTITRYNLPTWTDAILQSAYTFGGWVTMIAVNKGSDNTFLSHGTTSTNNGLHIVERSAGMYYGFYSNDVSAATGFSANTYYHVVYATNGAGQRSMWLNGVLQGTWSTAAYTGTGSNAMLGDEPWNLNAPLYGCMDDIFMYTRYLASSEVAALYNAYF